MSLFAGALRKHRDEINSLNVFPVPDGDTGSNMLLTQQAVVSAMTAMDGSATDLPALAEVIARASLAGARGNSGVILSQILRALAARLAAEDGGDASTFAAALHDASTEADRAVARPVGGTILSVLRDAASAASDAAGVGADLGSVAEAALQRARRSLAGTTNLLPELREAAVVDAGGRGLLLLFLALRAAIRDEPLAEPVGPSGPVGSASPVRAQVPGVEVRVAEVQFLLEAGEERVAALRGSLCDIGDSVAVVGGGGLYKVHVHTDDPEAALRLGQAAGVASAVSTMDLATAEGCVGGESRGVQVGPHRSAMVAVSEGPGLHAVFRSLGATVVRRRAAGRPSLDDLAAAIAAAPADHVLVLPNDPALVVTARRAARASPKAVRVVATASVPAGIAAATAFNPYDALDDNAAAAGEAGEVVRSGAVRPADRGDWVGIEDGVVLASGSSPEVAAGRLAAALAPLPPELVTVIVGDGPDQDEAERVVGAVKGAVPGAEVHVVDGGQPGSRYLIGVE